MKESAISFGTFYFQANHYGMHTTERRHLPRNTLEYKYVQDFFFVSICFSDVAIEMVTPDDF